MKNGFDIGIVGCGPAGLAAALLLHRQGHRVRMIERFDVPKALGSGIILQPTGLCVLAELGLLPEMLGHGKRIERMHGIACPSNRTVLDIRYQRLDPQLYGLAVHRSALFEALYHAVQQCEIEIIGRIEVVALEHRQNRLAVISENGNNFGKFDLIVDASGSSSRLHYCALAQPTYRKLEYGAIWGSFDWTGDSFRDDSLQQRYVGAHKMVGVLPIGRHREVTTDQVAFFWSLKTQTYPAWLELGLDVWKREVHKIWPETDSILEQITNPGQMSMARYGHHTLPRPVGNRVAFIGDSAHSTSPQLGQGANMALLDAWALASALRQGENINQALIDYEHLRRWHVRLFQVMSLALTPFYQSDSRLMALLRDALFVPMSKTPVLGKVMLGLVTGLSLNPIERLNLNLDAVKSAPKI